MMPTEKAWYWPRRNMILISWASGIYWEYEREEQIEPYAIAYEHEFILLGEV